MVDLGDHYTYFTYDMLPENMSPEKIQDIAFKNLSTNVQKSFDSDYGYDNLENTELGCAGAFIDWKNEIKNLIKGE